MIVVGLSKDDLELSEKKHIALLEGTGVVSTRLVTKQHGDLYTLALLVRKEVEPDDFIEVYFSFIALSDLILSANIMCSLYLVCIWFQVRIAVVGNVDAGKSTLLGVLTYSILDDGRGQARQKLFR